MPKKPEPQKKIASGGAPVALSIKKNELKKKKPPPKAILENPFKSNWSPLSPDISATIISKLATLNSNHSGELKHLIAAGINKVTRMLSRKEAVEVLLISADVKPQTLISHFMDFSTLQSVSIVCPLTSDGANTSLVLGKAIKMKSSTVVAIYGPKNAASQEARKSLQEFIGYIRSALKLGSSHQTDSNNQPKAKSGTGSVPFTPMKIKFSTPNPQRKPNIPKQAKSKKKAKNE
eukprot:TRINITY_DN10937_c0_g1_i1.p1 TRINITY_DN10937_c0_g1~~TRINITY_DN10937_c0_g1_i1.p1  ORF type:complete len:234 (-),score=40.61 TRINITY_DN10937_c0_g1_i1:4-705(-)